MDFKTVIRTIPDYPKPGIMFRDITTLLGNPRAFRRAVDELAAELGAVDGPRTTGDGYYEAVVLDPDGNRVELTV